MHVMMIAPLMTSPLTVGMMILTRIVFLCALVLYWVTGKETLGSAYTRNRRPQQQHSSSTPWRLAQKDTSGACQKGGNTGSDLYCETFKCSTLVAGGSPIPTMSGMFVEATTMTDPHPGSLVPGSIYLGASQERVDHVVQEDEDRSPPRGQPIHGAAADPPQAD